MKKKAFARLTCGLVSILALGLLLAASANAQDEQSPIVIDPAEVVTEPLPELNFMYGRATLRVENEGSHEEFGTVQAFLEPLGPGKLLVGADEFILERFHWHIPSEHELLVRGMPKEFDMEMHLVHTRTDAAGQKEILVVGVWIVDGKKNRELGKIFADLPPVEGEEAAREVRAFNLARLLPDEIGSYRYDGSLTTPSADVPFEPFLEGVKWIVLKEPMEMSVKQIGAFGELFLPETNDRDTQDIGARIVKTELVEEPVDGIDTDEEPDEEMLDGEDEVMTDGDDEDMEREDD